MSLKSKAKYLFERITGTLVIKKYPFGYDLIEDIKTKIPNFQFDVIFDVGANVSSVACSYATKIPKATIWSFEPSKDTYNEMVLNTRKFNNIKPINIALGNENKTAFLSQTGSSVVNRILKDADVSDTQLQTGIEQVQMFTISDFCKQNNINHIDYLKIDTEGYDLEVVHSAQEMLEENKIHFVEVEVGMNNTNKYHVPFETLKEYLESKQFYVFGIYEQVHEFITKRPILRRCNIVFISGELAKKSYQ